jgi:hypothetical protein
MSSDPPQVDRYPRRRGQRALIIAHGSRRRSPVRFDRFPDTDRAVGCRNIHIE